MENKVDMWQHMIAAAATVRAPSVASRIPDCPTDWSDCPASRNLHIRLSDCPTVQAYPETESVASTMVGLVEGIVYAHKAGLDVSRYLDAISTGAAGSKSLDLYGGRILKRYFAAGFYVNHFVKDLGICLSECQKMGLALPGLALAQQLYLSLKAHGEGDLGTQALILALERLNNVKLEAVKEA
ncbi:unnamed protein product [Rhodiola kirilowii]